MPIAGSLWMHDSGLEEPEQFDVFVSYQKLDEEWARNLTKRLESETSEGRTLRVFFAPWDIAPGENIIDRIDKALGEAKYVVLILSPEYLSADWPIAEKAAAIYSDPAGRIGRLIPVLRRKCRIPPLLAFRNYVNMTDDSRFELEYLKLVSRIKGISLRSTGLSATEKAAEKTRETSSPLILDQESWKADEVSETLYSNLFPYSNIPDRIWSAPAEFRDRREIWQYVGKGVWLPGFYLREKRLFT
ncbi:MAG: toll/interleukin-1 receptor domain-containing protein, partial [Thermoplasmata archaeon]|nr:toll/interleukin-1 receptor domain-containing protein [Thermoplasmata archaeon]